MEDPGQTQPVGATVWQLGEGDSRALLHKSAPDIGWRRGKLVTNGQGQPLGASAKETPICQVYLDLILAPPHSHQQGSSSLVSMVTSVHSPVTMSFPVLRTPGQGISPLPFTQHPLLSIWPTAVINIINYPILASELGPLSTLSLILTGQP